MLGNCVNLSTIKVSDDLKTKTIDHQKAKAQWAMLRLLALGRKQIEDGKVIEHDDVVAIFETEDNNRSSA
jgi:predicted transcriptional regulator